METQEISIFQIQGGWDNMQTITFNNLPFTAGESEIRVIVDGNYLDLDYLNFTFITNTFDANQICKGDYNSDQLVNTDDFSIFGLYYKQSYLPDCFMDIYGDNCKLELDDFSAFAFKHNQPDACSTL